MRYSNALTLAAGHSNVCFSLGSRALGSSWFAEFSDSDDIHLFKWHLEKLHRAVKDSQIRKASRGSQGALIFGIKVCGFWSNDNNDWRWRSRQIRKILKFHRGKNARLLLNANRIYINQLNQVESLSMTWILPSLSFRQDAQGLTALAKALKAWKARDQSNEWEPLICLSTIWSRTNLLQVSFLYM